tara:strand:+ start:1503 stop:2369 length:867 start_codon:yes stop_codon:yes gene_type:complete
MNFTNLIIFILVIFLLQKIIISSDLSKIEKFSSTSDNEKINIQNSIKKYYDFNWEGMSYFKRLINEYYKDSTIFSTEKSIKNPMRLDIPGDVQLEKLEGLEKGVIMSYYSKDFKNKNELKEYLKKYNWALCDGTTVENSEGEEYTTPDLTDRFLLGYENTNDLAASGKAGGEDKIKLNLAPRHSHTLQQNPGHTHKYTDFYTPYGGGSNDEAGNQMITGGTGFYTGDSPIGIYKGGTLTKHKVRVGGSTALISEQVDGLHDHKLNNTGSNAPMNNTPPFIKLFFIIKI